MVRYLDLTEYLLIAEATLGVEAAVLAKIADLGLADMALNAPAAGYAEVDLYPDLLMKAGVLCVRVANNHALPNGNKRVAFECMRAFLEENGITWHSPEPDEVVAVMLRVATGDMHEAEVAEWIAAHTSGPSG